MDPRKNLGMKSGRSWSLEARQATEVSSLRHWSVFALVKQYMKEYLGNKQSQSPFYCINRILFHHCAGGSPEFWVSGLFQQWWRAWSWRRTTWASFARIPNKAIRRTRLSGCGLVSIRYSGGKDLSLPSSMLEPIAWTSSTSSWENPMGLPWGFWISHLQWLLSWKVQVWPVLKDTKD